MYVQNKNFGFVFGTFLAPVWPYHLEIATCKTTVNLLSYGIGIDLLKGGSQQQMRIQILALFFFVFGSFQPLYWLYRSEITSCIFLSLKICIGISSYNVNHEKQIWPFLAKRFFQFLAHFRQLLWHNRLDIARCTTTVGGRLYGVTGMALICNAQEEMCVQNIKIGFVFGTFLAPVWPYRLKSCQVQNFN